MNENLKEMNDQQKEAVLNVIKGVAKKSIAKAFVIPCIGGILTYVILALGENTSDNVLANIMLAIWIALLVSLKWMEDIVKNIMRLFQVKALKEGSIYWTVLPVRQCTRSINIFERWYRYAHYEYDGKLHKDWMIIGRNPIDKVTCLFSANDTSKPYAYKPYWFKGILY